eukprot:CAMPEP_0182450898 /NCGR_PEP_ID=MMETSP1172-20130603/43423_1 /TAXON_ID=708627 /ORGANISM="Timspurckia oligopyrenoides, Strain CCMP3278" /LENGTH=452 /DNA_ID=CAMNT_0024648621 /DNA_START=248 /DNA_END=1606 /DNA_ORIENTATION=+
MKRATKSTKQKGKTVPKNSKTRSKAVERSKSQSEKAQSSAQGKDKAQSAAAAPSGGTLQPKSMALAAFDQNSNANTSVKLVTASDKFQTMQERAGPSTGLMMGFLAATPSFFPQFNAIDIIPRTKRGRLLTEGSKVSIARVEHLEDRLESRSEELKSLTETVEYRVSNMMLRTRTYAQENHATQAFPENDQDVDYFFEDSYWVSEENMRIRNGLMVQLKQIRESMGKQLIQLDHELELQSKFRPVMREEIQSRRECLTQLYFKLRQDLVRKYQAYFRSLKSIDASRKSRKNALSPKASFVLRSWLFDHVLKPYPNDEEKMKLARTTGLSVIQVSNWFINARVRLWKPMINALRSDGATAIYSRSPQTSSESNPPPKVVRLKGNTNETAKELEVRSETRVAQKSKAIEKNAKSTNTLKTASKSKSNSVRKDRNNLTIPVLRSADSSVVVGKAA